MTIVHCLSYTQASLLREESRKVKPIFYIFFAITALALKKDELFVLPIKGTFMKLGFIMTYALRSTGSGKPIFMLWILAEVILFRSQKLG